MMRLSALLLLALGGPVAAERLPPAGTLTLPLDDPILPVEIGGLPLRLRVDFDAGNSLVINPDVVARLPLRFTRGAAIQIGRVELPGQHAEADVVIQGRVMRTGIEAYAAPCCAGVDGMIGPELLPFAEVRLVRVGAPGYPRRSYPADADREAGAYIAAPTPEGIVRVRLAFARITSSASRSAGVMIASAAGGTLDEARFGVAVPFGVTRPAAMLRLARPFDAAGFRLNRVAVRVADFGGSRRFPDTEPVRSAPGDITVRQRNDTQPEWPALTLGHDVLGGCAEIAYSRAARTITLACPQEAMP